MGGGMGEVVRDAAGMIGWASRRFAPGGFVIPADGPRSLPRVRTTVMEDERVPPVPPGAGDDPLAMRRTAIGRAVVA